ncbi:MAG: dienelactone hydrolase family protein [Gemmataceae bacterium]|nr:dienelactone hydrolase family protein [Gemmataceae bacterium]
MVRRLLALMTLIAAAVTSSAHEKTGFIEKTLAGSDDQRKYVVFVPHDYKGDKAYPTILFLHGAGETGKDNKAQVRVGLAAAVRKNEKTFPFIVVFPQSHNRTWKAGSDDGKAAVAALEEVQKDYKVDSARIYLTGLSMGGFGAWSHAAAFPEKWAAIAPICGGGDVKTAEKIKDIPCWCFHGDKDAAVKVELSRMMIEAIKKAGGDPKYTEYPGVNHNSWDRAYATRELYDWMLQQKRK